jgi:hypothetical protein
MTTRGSRLAVLVVTAAAVLALAGAGHGHTGYASVREDAGNRSVVLPLTWIDGLTTGLNGVERRESSDGSGEYRVLLVAVVAALLVAAAAPRRSIVLDRLVRCGLPSWATGTARAPPVPAS